MKKFAFPLKALDPKYWPDKNLSEFTTVVGAYDNEEVYGNKIRAILRDNEVSASLRLRLSPNCVEFLKFLLENEWLADGVECEFESHEYEIEF